MKKIMMLILFLFLIYPQNINAKSGCCSHHGGVAGCGSDGRTICNDGTYSPTCTCSPPIVYGCTDTEAKNHNRNANKDNGSCQYNIPGCMNKKATNYNAKANQADGSCHFVTEEIEEVPVTYKTEYQYLEDKLETEVSVIQEGEAGLVSKKIKVTKDEQGNIVLKETVEENSLKEAKPKIIAKGTKTPKVESTPQKKPSSNNTPSVSGFVYLIIASLGIIYQSKVKDERTILSKIKKQSNKNIKIVYYIGYVLLVLPPIVDIGILIYDRFKK